MIKRHGKIQARQGVDVMSGSTSVGSGNGVTTVFSYSGKLQTFTIPTTGTYDIVAEGAQRELSVPQVFRARAPRPRMVLIALMASRSKVPRCFTTAMLS